MIRPEELALLGRGPGRQLRQPRLARAARPGAGGLGHRREGGADVAQAERGHGGGRNLARQAAHAEHPGIGGGERVGGEEGHGQPHLVGLHGAQELGHEPALVEPAGRRFQPPPQGRELREGRHEVIVRGRLRRPGAEAVI